jgi:hypothetical protein
MSWDYILGNETASNSFEDDNNIIYITKFTSTTAFTADSMHLWCIGYPSGNVTMAIYADNGSGTKPGALLRSTGNKALTADDDWHSDDLSSTLSIAASTIYWLGYQSDEYGHEIGSDFGGTGREWNRQSSTYEWPATWTTSGDNHWANTLQIIVTGVATPAPAPAVARRRRVKMMVSQ